MVHWVYILKCEDDFIYVGETEHIFKRFDQHLKGRGAKNTSMHIPHTLIGLYKVSDNYSFYEYRTQSDIKTVVDNWAINTGNHLFIENKITERLFYERRNNSEYGSHNEWYRVRGGKYTRDYMDFALHHAKAWSERSNRIIGSYRATSPIFRMSENEIVDRPLCKCGMPAEVKLSKDKSKVYFVCATKNVWPDFYKFLTVSPSCDFWELFVSSKQSPDS